MENEKINENTENSQSDEEITDNRGETYEAPTEEGDKPDTQIYTDSDELSDDNPDELPEEDFHEKYPDTLGVEIRDKEKYSALRTLGLSHDEAYYFSERREVARDGRAHLISTVPSFAKSPTMAMSKRELNEARDLFVGLSDAEIIKLHKKVTNQ